MDGQVQSGLLERNTVQLLGLASFQKYPLSHFKDALGWLLNTEFNSEYGYSCFMCMS